MVTRLKVYLRKTAERRWLRNLARGKLYKLERSTWEPARRGFVWTWIQRGTPQGKVRFMVEDCRIGEPEQIKIWSLRRGRGKSGGFPEARVVGAFVQWLHHRAREDVRRIEIFVPQRTQT